MANLVLTTNITSTGTNVTYKELTISSKDRINPSTTSSSNFVVNLPQPVSMTNIYVKSVILPQSFYTIPNDGSNVVAGSSVVFQLVISAVFTNVYIPYGSYNNGTLATALQTALNNIATGFTVTISSTTAKTVISNSTTAFGLGFDSPSQIRFGQVFGFLNGVSDPYTLPTPLFIGSTLVSGVNTIAGSFIVNLEYFLNIYIKSSAITSAATIQSLYSSGPAVDGSNTQNTTIALLPATYAFTFITWENQSDLRFEISPTYLFTQIDIQLVGDFGWPVDLNGQDWVLVLAYYG